MRSENRRFQTVCNENKNLREWAYQIVWPCRTTLWRIKTIGEGINYFRRLSIIPAHKKSIMLKRINQSRSICWCSDQVILNHWDELSGYLMSNVSSSQIAIDGVQRSIPMTRSKGEYWLSHSCRDPWPHIDLLLERGYRSTESNECSMLTA